MRTKIILKIFHYCLERDFHHCLHMRYGGQLKKWPLVSLRGRVQQCSFHTIWSYHHAGPADKVSSNPMFDFRRKTSFKLGHFKRLPCFIAWGYRHEIYMDTFCKNRSIGSCFHFSVYAIVKATIELQRWRCFENFLFLTISAPEFVHRQTNKPTPLYIKKKMNMNYKQYTT